MYSFIFAPECDCVLPNTWYGNSSVCNETTGQCSCKPKIGGRQCDRCHENAYNTSRGCVGKCACTFVNCSLFLPLYLDPLKSCQKIFKVPFFQFQFLIQHIRIAANGSNKTTIQAVPLFSYWRVKQATQRAKIAPLRVLRVLAGGNFRTCSRVPLALLSLRKMRECS